MADVTLKVLDMYGIRTSFNLIIANNHAVNDGIILDLALEIQDLSQEDWQIACLVHVLNLTPQTVLKTLRSEAKERDVDLLIEDCDNSDDNNEVNTATSPHKICQIVAKVRSSYIL